ncbi:MAG: type VI secretion system membrane subunit TssM [Planctomycetes bacterium]|nr:type VI secretion system membrane subunit TssM [Planctomycetota bacterium]
MRQVLSALMKEGVISVVVLILLCLLVWFGGMYLESEPNEYLKTRIAIIAVLIGIFLVLFLIQKVMAVRSAVKIEQQLKAQSGSHLEGADAEKKAEIETLSKNFNESLEALKKTKGGKSALFTLPWYIIIGPPGSGKTTALQESGLNFPAAQGGAKVRGIGGTRNCDWWFTEDGILLDTAGRYTTVAEDQEEWFAFLEMIRTSRKDKPINGAIVAIAIDELHRATAAELDQIAKDVRNRLDELAARLQAVFPVYMMFTKCDLIQGFVEFYEDFNKEQRGQVWGFTFPYSLPDKQYTEVFAEQVAKMTGNINARQLDLLATERPPAKKQSIYLFPRQFALAQVKMKEFLAALFHANAFQESAMLRGIYFTSGTQKGTPIDQILARMGEAMGLEAGSTGGEDRVEKKSYFIHNLFTNVIFHDKTLARSSSRVLRKRRAARLTLQITSLLALALMSWALLQSFFGNHEIIEKVETAGVGVRDLELDSRPDLEELKSLDALRRELSHLDEFKREGRPIRLSFGMYKGDAMFDAGADVYFRRLRPLYIAPCGQRVERELDRLVGSLQPNSPSNEYQKLLDLWRVYRMIGGKLEPQAALVSNILKKENRWSGMLGGMNTDEIEALSGEQLEFYAAQLAVTNKDEDKYGLYVTLDPQLDKRAADKLQNAFWTVSAYEAIIQHTSENRKPLRLEDLVPTNSAYVELRTNDTAGTNLSRLNAFTQEAWDTEIKSLIDDRSIDLEALYNELGIKKTRGDIRADLYKRHLAAQIDVWNVFLQQVFPKPSLFGNVKDTNEALKILVSDQSPYRELIRNVWAKRQLALAVDNKIDGPSEADLKALDTSFAALETFSKAYNTFWSTGGRKGSRVMSYIDNKVPLPTLATAFLSAAQDVPQPFATRDDAVKVALLKIIDVSFDALKSEADAEVKEFWTDGPQSLWKSSFASKYPFDTKAKDSVSMVNFSRMFSPKSGSIWNVDKRVREVQKIAFHGGRRLVTLTQEYENTIRLATDIREAMYDTENDEYVKVKFSVKLVQAGLLVESLIEIGTDENGNVESLPYNKYPDQTRDFTWAQYNTGRSKMGARVTAKYTERKIPLPGKGQLDDEWGLLRLVHRPYALSFTQDEASETPVYRCLWEFKSADGQLFYLQAEFAPRKKINPFQDDLFPNFSLAEAVSK